MAERMMRREPVFSDDPDPHGAAFYETGPVERQTRSRTRRILAAPGRLIAFVFVAALVTAFLANALYLQKGPRPALWFDASSLWRGTLSLNPLNLFVRPALDHATPSADPAPQPPRRSSNGEATPLPSPMPVTTTQKPQTPVNQAPSTLVASADPKQVFAPPLAIPSNDNVDPVGALVQQTLPKPDKTVLAAQRALNKLGYGPVSPDGLKSGTMREALLRFQKDKHVPSTGEIDAVTKPLLAKASGIAVD
jgi:Putative peptidoglycan binding domain